VPVTTSTTVDRATPASIPSPTRLDPTRRRTLAASSSPSVLDLPAPASNPAGVAQVHQQEIDAAMSLAEQLLPPGRTIDQLEVAPGDGVIGAAARLAIGTVCAVAALDPAGLARLVAERDQLRSQVAQLTSGADETSGHPHEVPTPGQVWASMLSMDADGRLRTIEHSRHLAARATRCAELAHDGRIADLERQLRLSAARTLELERELEDLELLRRTDPQPQNPADPADPDAPANPDAPTGPGDDETAPQR
jgi:hypothetical protein